MISCTCINHSKYFCFIHVALMTQTLGMALKDIGVQPCLAQISVGDAETKDSEYFVVGVSNPYMDVLKGFKKFTKDQAKEILTKIQNESISIDDVYVRY